ncbi:hypothetical protein [Sinorhizobium meliloti]|jgi:hypothetical protein|uniref:hypothetical protein n=1 Tax=Rhizobium meliloti TaxID=382 RepID=UPI000FDCC27F|nr:hypothetical protein [Sinorhizobium meliloti]RVG29772.1 hypothetical protein CN225_24230 [Sinorhizobium meliloti]
MLQTVRTIASDPLVALLLAVLSILITYLLYRLSKAKTRLLVHREEVSLISTAKSSKFTSELEISYNSVKVPVVTVSTFTVWNGGTSVLRSSDIAPSDGLRFETDDQHNRIFKVEVRQSRPVNGVRVDAKSPENRASVSFDFFDPGEGFVCEIVHDAEIKSIRLKGTVMGAPRSPERIVDLPKLVMPLGPAKIGINGERIFGLLCCVFGVPFLAAAVSPAVAEAINSVPEWMLAVQSFAKLAWVNAIVAALFFVPGLFLMWLSWVSPTRPNHLLLLAENE